MTKLMEAAKLPDDLQDSLAAVILQEIDSERRWDELFARPESWDLLSKLADKAIANRQTTLTPAAHPDLTTKGLGHAVPSRSALVSRGGPARMRSSRPGHAGPGRVGTPSEGVNGRAHRLFRLLQRDLRRHDARGSGGCRG